MKRIKLNGLLLTVLLFANTTLIAQSKGIEQFGWMLGSWKGETGEGVLYESWVRRDENTMLGEGYYIVNADTVLTELLRIQKVGNYWTFIPIINNNQPALFTLIESGNNNWVFENKEHDFPQRVVYSQRKGGSMFAWIEGEMDGEQMKEEYLMERIK